ncbi:acyl-CoA synthetase [Flindersiella endophytica]
MRDQGIGSWLTRRDRKTPHRVAVRFESRAWTYRELYQRSNRLAHALRTLGIERGDRVAYLGPNHPAFLETLFATAALGAVFVPLNPRLAVPELRYVLANSTSRVLIASAGLRPAATAVAEEVESLVLVDDSYETLLAEAGTATIDEPVSLDDLAMVMYTSGTTGRPKGAMLTHGNLTWNSVNVLVDSDLRGDEVTLVCAPLFHTAGLNMTCLPTILKGGTAVLMERFDPGAALRLIEQHAVTYLFGVPAMYDAMALAPEWATADLSSLRTLTCGGAPVPARTIDTYLERGFTFVQGYGMTEASPGVLFLDRDQVAAKAGTAGVPHFFTDVRVVDARGADVAPGEKGEVVVHGPNVMRGYWDLPAESAAAIDEGGWFRTGDIAVVDDDGFVSLVDRVKDMFISGGENVYPAEIEGALHSHPAVADCAVIGVPDQKWGEVGRALVVLAPGESADEQAILAFLDGRIAAYKVPRSVRFVDELPRSASGKLLKVPLREAYGQK